MKIIHCADIHLGSALESKFPREKTEIRRREVLSSFKRMIDYAHENEVRIILLSGDVFDADRPTKRDRDYFYNEVRNNPDIDFIYLCGNHDKDGALFNEEIPNLKRFSKNDLIKYSYDNIDISGIEITDENYRTFYSNINLEKNKINIVLLHGELTNSVGIDKIKINNLI
nr:metallophosphoesterase [Clostridia bacterium]